MDDIDDLWWILFLKILNFIKKSPRYGILQFDVEDGANIEIITCPAFVMTDI